MLSGKVESLVKGFNISLKGKASCLITELLFTLRQIPDWWRLISPDFGPRTTIIELHMGKYMVLI